MRFGADGSFADVAQPAVIVHPGGRGTRPLMRDAAHLQPRSVLGGHRCADDQCVHRIPRLRRGRPARRAAGDDPLGSTRHPRRAGPEHSAPPRRPVRRRRGTSSPRPASRRGSTWPCTWSTGWRVRSAPARCGARSSTTPSRRSDPRDPTRAETRQCRTRATAAPGQATSAAPRVRNTVVTNVRNRASGSVSAIRRDRSPVRLDPADPGRHLRHVGRADLDLEHRSRAHIGGRSVARAPYRGFGLRGDEFAGGLRMQAERRVAADRLLDDGRVDAGEQSLGLLARDPVPGDQHDRYLGARRRPGS